MADFAYCGLLRKGGMAQMRSISCTVKAGTVIALAAVVVVLATRNRQPGEGAAITYSLIVSEEAARLSTIAQYDLECHISPDLRSYAGRLNVKVPAKLSETSELLFHIPPNYGRSQAGRKEKNATITSVLLDGVPVPFRDENSLLWVSIPEKSRAQNIVIALSFKSRLPELKLPATFLQSNINL
jgi:hypothetical protein